MRLSSRSLDLSVARLSSSCQLNPFKQRKTPSITIRCIWHEVHEVYVIAEIAYFGRAATATRCSASDVDRAIGGRVGVDRADLATGSQVSVERTIESISRG